MAGFQESIQMMHELLRGEKKPCDMADTFHADVRRLSIYPAFVMGHVTRFLDTNFISLRSLFDQVVWNELCETYFYQHPPRDWRLYRSAENFPSYLSESKKTEKYGITDFHVELAKFEWVEISVYKSKLIIPRPDEVKSITLNPTLTILQLNYPVTKFVHLNRSQNLSKSQKTKTPDTFLAENPENIFFFRNPESHLAHFCVPNGLLLFAFKLAHDGISPEEAAETSGRNMSEIKDILNEARKIGLIIYPDKYI